MHYGLPPYVPEYRDMKNTTLTVHGEGMVKAKPDVVITTLGVVTEEPTVKAAQESNESSSQALLTALKNMGIEEKNIATISYTITPEYDIEEGKTKLRGYRVEHLYEVTVLNVQKAGEVYAVAVQAGANISRGLTFRVSQPDKYVNQALILAIHNAQEKANVIAKTLHVTLHPVPITIIEEKGSYHEAKFATTILAATPSIEPGEMNITANITVTFTYM